MKKTNPNQPSNQKKCQPQPHKEVYNGSLRNIGPIEELDFSYNISAGLA